MQLPSGQRNKHQGINLPTPAVRAKAHGVMVFAIATINQQHHIPAPHHDCKNACHCDSAATCTYRRTLGLNY